MHYVLSDIHGDSAAFDKILSMINLQAEDHLFILGDVIDRGSDGIALLQRIRQMKNCTLLLGNHELMMIKAYRYPEEWDYMYIWRGNGCHPTIEEYEKLSKNEQEEVLQYMEKLPLQKEITVGEETFILVHAAPKEMYRSSRRRCLEDFCVWERYDPAPQLIKGKTVIYGHTPTRKYIYPESKQMRIVHGDRMIDIDCGCAYPNQRGQLGCLRLEDMMEYYSIDGVVTAEEAQRWTKENLTNRWRKAIALSKRDGQSDAQQAAKEGKIKDEGNNGIVEPGSPDPS